MSTPVNTSKSINPSQGIGTGYSQSNSYSHHSQSHHSPIYTHHYHSIHPHSHHLDDLKKIHICRNCGTTGHVYKTCPQPIASFGLICYRHIGTHPEYLMIQRKDSLSFMEFIRGKYDTSDIKYISKLLGHMTITEREMLITKSFEHLWNHIWFQKTIQRHTADFDISRNKFNNLTMGIELTDDQGEVKTYTLASLIDDSKSPFTEPEWGFPKGRRRLREADVDCAVREFCEETGFIPSDVRICTEIKPFEEVFYGTNAILYRHVYFIAELVSNRERKIIIDQTNIHQAREVQQARWFTFEDVIDHIRNHNLERKELFTCAHKAVEKIYNKEQKG